VKYSCAFIHPVTGECKTVVTDVSDDELELARLADDVELYQQAFALARAYRGEAAGFAHVARPRRLS
jgi:hypothetical protein